MRITSSALAVVLSLLFLVACGAANPGGGGGGSLARSATCAEVQGIPAIYWDFMNGLARTDLPPSTRTIPYAQGGAFFHPQQPLYNFIYPVGWQPVQLFVPAQQLTGVNLVRNDGQALWRRLNLTIPGGFSSQQAVVEEITLMAQNLGLDGAPEFICSLAESVPGMDRTSALLNFDGFTANISTSAFHTNGVTVLFIQVAIAPSNQYAVLTNDVFFALSAQMLLDGAGDVPECRDGQDNDGDGLVDFPADPGCTSPEDDSE